MSGKHIINYHTYTGGHINPAVTFGLFVGRKLSLVRTLLYIVAQCLGAICGVGIVKGIMKVPYNSLGGGANAVATGPSDGVLTGYSVGSALAAEIVGTFILVYTVFSATDPKRTARDSFIPVRRPRLSRARGSPGPTSTRACFPLLQLQVQMC